MTATNSRNDGGDVDRAGDIADADMSHGWPGVAGYSHDGAAYCVDCANADTRIDTVTAHCEPETLAFTGAILADEEWDYRPHCDHCSIGLDVTVTQTIDRGAGMVTDGGESSPDGYERRRVCCEDCLTGDTRLVPVAYDEGDSARLECFSCDADTEFSIGGRPARQRCVRCGATSPADEVAPTGQCAAGSASDPTHDWEDTQTTIDRGDGVATDGGRELPCDWEPDATGRDRSWQNEDKRITCYLWCMDPDSALYDDEEIDRMYPEGFRYTVRIADETRDLIDSGEIAMPHTKDNALDAAFDLMWSHSVDRRDRAALEGRMDDVTGSNAGEYRSVSLEDSAPSAACGRLKGARKTAGGELRVVTTAGKRTIVSEHTADGALVVDYADGTYGELAPSEILSIDAAGLSPDA